MGVSAPSLPARPGASGCRWPAAASPCWRRDRPGLRIVAPDDRTTAPHPPGALPRPRFPGCAVRALQEPRVELSPSPPAHVASPPSRPDRERPAVGPCAGAAAGQQGTATPAATGSQGGGAAVARGRPGTGRSTPCPLSVPTAVPTAALPLFRAFRPALPPARVPRGGTPPRASPRPGRPFATQRDHYSPSRRAPGGPPGPPGRSRRGPRPGTRQKSTGPKYAESVADQGLRPARCWLRGFARRPRQRSAAGPFGCRREPTATTIITSRSVSIRPRRPARRAAHDRAPALRTGPSTPGAGATPENHPTRRRSSPGAVTAAPAQP